LLNVKSFYANAWDTQGREWWCNGRGARGAYEGCAVGSAWLPVTPSRVHARTRSGLRCGAELCDK